MVKTPPGVSVWPGPSTNAVVPPCTEAVIADWLPWVPTVKTGRPGAASVDVTPLTTTVEPSPFAGKLNVVPSRVITPPGVRVWLPMANTVVPPITDAEKI